MRKFFQPAFERRFFDGQIVRVVGRHRDSSTPSRLFSLTRRRTMSFPSLDRGWKKGEGLLEPKSPLNGLNLLIITSGAHCRWLNTSLLESRCCLDWCSAGRRSRSKSKCHENSIIVRLIATLPTVICHLPFCFSGISSRSCQTLQVATSRCRRCKVEERLEKRWVTGHVGL